MSARLRLGLVIGVLVGGWLTAGCDSTNGRTAPTAADPAAGPSAPSPDRPVPPAPQPTPSAGCDAGLAQGAVGQQASDALLERARIDAGATTARFLRPNQPITMEYFGWRLNLGLDERDVVNAVSCG
jgi:hypothetical protein